MAKKQKQSRAKTDSTRGQTSQEMLHYTITDEPIMDKVYRRLPASVKDEIELLHDLAKTRPTEAIPKLEALRERYPKIQQLSNYLAAAYFQLGDKAKIAQIVQENYERDPEYLFARIHYAEYCLENGQYAKIAEIFNHKFDLRALYPNRNEFHVSEAAGFFGVIGLYFFKTGERDLAQNVYAILQNIAPRNQVTRRLRRHLYPSLWRRFLMRIAQSIGIDLILI